MREIAGKAVSDLAQPVVTADEMAGASIAICRYHHGRIADHLSQGDAVGKAYYCPIGKMWWRLSSRIDGMHRPLMFPKGL